jgi:hypothetical protein
MLAVALCSLAISSTAQAAQSARFVADGAKSATFFNHGGLKLRATCEPGADPQLSVTARSTVPHAMLHLNSQSDRDADSSDEVDFRENDDLGEAPFPILDGLSDDGSGQLLYATRRGATISIDWLAEEGDAHGGRVCAFLGTGHVATRREDTKTLPRVSFRANEGDARTILDAAGLRLEGECAAGPGLSVSATSTVDDAAIHATGQGAEARYYEDDDFDDGNGDAQAAIELLSELDVDGPAEGADNASGQVVYSRPNGTHLRIDWMAEEEDAFGGTRSCVFAGTAKVVGRGHEHRVDYRADADGPDDRLFWKGNGLKLYGSCEDTGSNEIEITAKSRKPLATLHANAQGAGDSHAYFEEDGLAAGQAGEIDLTAGLEAGDDAAGQIIYSRRDGPHASVDWMAEVDDAYGGGFDCVFAGSGEVPRAG